MRSGLIKVVKLARLATNTVRAIPRKLERTSGNPAEAGGDTCDRDPFALHNRENDVEHMYGLALMVWRVIEENNLPLDSAKAKDYALVHDLVEVYAGDTPNFTASAEFAADKEKREAAALQRLLDEGLITDRQAELIEKYNKLGEVVKAGLKSGKDTSDIDLSGFDEEVKLVYAMDGLHPMYIFAEQRLAHARTSKKHPQTPDKWREWIEPRVRVSKYAVPVLDEIYEIIKEIPELWPDVDGANVAEKL
jgi:5'-deoxynucleotidase YfbR-like HD superfamily hydrolase